MRDILISKADLVSEPRMPLILLEVYAHASWHEITVARWEQGGHTLERAPQPFALTEMRRHVRDGFDRLRKEQAALLGRRLGRRDST